MGQQRESHEEQFIPLGFIDMISYDFTEYQLGKKIIPTTSKVSLAYLWDFPELTSSNQKVGRGKTKGFVIFIPVLMIVHFPSLSLSVASSLGFDLDQEVYLFFCFSSFFLKSFYRRVLLYFLFSRSQVPIRSL